MTESIFAYGKARAPAGSVQFRARQPLSLSVPGFGSTPTLPLHFGRTGVGPVPKFRPNPKTATATGSTGLSQVKRALKHQETINLLWSTIKT